MGNRTATGTESCIPSDRDTMLAGQSGPEWPFRMPHSHSRFVVPPERFARPSAARHAASTLPALAAPSPVSDDNPQSFPPILSGTIDKAYAWERSQTERCIRGFVHRGYNADAQGRRMFDGVMPHVSGGGPGVDEPPLRPNRRPRRPTVREPR